MSVNLAKPAAKILMLFGVLCIVAMPFVGIWMLSEETAPITLILTDTELISTHASTQYTIPLGAIESVELIDELPSTSKQNGVNFENLYKGRFSVIGYGTVNMCLHPKNPPILVVRAGGELYFLNDTDANVTQAVYAGLVRKEPP